MNSSKITERPGKYLFQNNFQLKLMPLLGILSLVQRVGKAVLTSEVNSFKLFLTYMLFEMLVGFS